MPVKKKSMNTSKLIIVVIIICTSFFASCKKDVVVIDNPVIIANPVIAAPIGQVGLTLSHIIDPNDPLDTLITAANNTYQVVLAQKDVVSVGFDNLVTIPSQTILSRNMKMGSVSVDDISASQSVSINDISSSIGGSTQSSLTVAVADINIGQTISLSSISNDAGGSLQSSLNISSAAVSQSFTLNNIANDAGGSLQSSLNIDSVSTTQNFTLNDVANDAGGAFQASLSISSVNTSQGITLGSISNNIGGTFQSVIQTANGSNSYFPSISQSNVGTYSGGSLGNFTSATLSSGSMTLTATNGWPVTVTMNIDLVDTTSGATIFSFTFPNILSGDSATQTKSLSGVTLPSTLGFKIVSVSSPGSGFITVPIDVSDEITLAISTANMIASSYLAPFPSLSQTNLGTYSGGNLGNFASATFSSGAMDMSIANNWPVALSITMDIVDTLTGVAILSYSFANVAGNGGTSTISKSLVGITLPNSLGFKIASVSSSGSVGSVNIDLSDDISLSIFSSNMVASSLVAPFPSFSESNVGTYSAGSLGSFNSATFSNGSMDLEITNNWPVSLGMSISLVNILDSTVILTFNFPSIAPGGSSSVMNSLIGVTLPNTLGFKIVSVSSSGSIGDVNIDLADDIQLDITTVNMVASSLVAPFPSFSETNVGTYSAGSLGNFTSASFSNGSLTLGLVNNWPVDLSMALDLVNTQNDSTLLSYSFTNLSKNGGSSSQSQSLVGKTLPSTLGFKVTSVSSPGSASLPVNINMADTLSINISSANLVASSFIAPFPAINSTNVGTYSAGTFSTFTSASFLQGSLSLEMTNDWPVDLSMGIDLVNTATNATILSYTFNNVTADGGNSMQTGSLVGITLPSSIGLKINSVTSAGSPITPVNIDLADAITFNVSSANLKVYNAIVKLDTMSLSSQNEIVDMGLGGIEINEVSFNTCHLDYEFVSTIKADVELSLKLPSSDKNGNPIDTTILIASDQTTSGTIYLNSTLLDLSTDTVQSHSKLPIEISATILGTPGQVTVDSAHGIASTFDLSNISFEYIEGYFGDTVTTLPSESIDLNLDILNQFQGEMTFQNPSIILDVTSSVGLPIELNLAFESFRSGIGYALNGTPQIFPYPTSIGDSASGSIYYDNTNSSITDVFTFPFDSIRYGGQVTINPDTITYGKYNFITSDSKISADLLMELPFTFTTAGLMLSDTVTQNLNLGSLITSEIYTINYAKLLFEVTSTLPLDASINLKFYNANGDLVLVKPLPLMISGLPNTDGIVTVASTTNSYLVLSNTDFDDLVSAKTVSAEVTMATYNGGTVPVKLRTDASISISLGLEAKLNVEL